MVVFTCNACGESVKKGQVEKHVNICWNCQCLSCMDCGKDFWGNDYKLHVKCLSEDEKYGGKSHEAKTHKGDMKQQEWIQKIHGAIRETNISPKVRDILEQMYSYDNIPRKKQKFQNWMTNSLKIHSAVLQDEVWNIFSEATRKVASEGEGGKKNGGLPCTSQECVQSEVQEAAENQSVESEATLMRSEDTDVKTEKITKLKRKREPKEERENRKKKKGLSLQPQQESTEFVKCRESKRKDLHANKFESDDLKMTKQHPGVDPAISEVNGNAPNTQGQRTKASKKKRGPSIIQKHPKNSETEETEEEHRDKFNWKGTIKAVLKQAPDNEIPIKKLRKKVLAQYYAVAGDHHKSEEEILALFNKKISNNPKFRVLKEKVKLLK